MKTYVNQFYYRNSAYKNQSQIQPCIVTIIHSPGHINRKEKVELNLNLDFKLNICM